jgi:hypothetical protein
MPGNADFPAQVPKEFPIHFVDDRVCLVPWHRAEHNLLRSFSLLDGFQIKRNTVGAKLDPCDGLNVIEREVDCLFLDNIEVIAHL